MLASAAAIAQSPTFFRIGNQTLYLNTMKLGYTIIYVADVPRSIAFYETAFGFQKKFIHESNLYGELDTGETILSFAGIEAAEMNGLSVLPNDPNGPAAAWEICFVSDNVPVAYDRAIAAGCSPVSAPAEKPWGQVVSYVRDLDGCLVEIASPVEPSV